ncbi:hypothetical protein Tco_0725895 [Tanacetum coccineum]|uniref:Uncharacterized protein n=1 Tax=Tanacetum coccineum TaxID=301880 RepID=A0ABQ4YDZ6_9ASTR
MGTIDSMKSILTQSDLDAMCEKFHIPDTVHPELPGPNDRIRNSPTEMDWFAFIHHVDPTKAEATGQVATVEAAKAARANELNILKERNSAFEEEKGALESKVAALESADSTKVAELVSLNAQVSKLTKDLSDLGLSWDELSIKASTLEVERDRLVGQVSSLEGICSGLRDEVSGYKLFKEQTKAVQDEQVRVLSEKVAGLDSELMDYLTALGKAIGRAIDKANFVSAMNALRAVDFPILAQLASQKDASIADIMGSLHLEGHAAEIPEAEQLHPSPEQLMLPNHRPEDQVVIGETSLSFSLDVVHSRVQRIRGDATSQRLSITDAIVPLIEPLSAGNLIGEASTSGVPAMTTTMSTTFIQTSSVPPISTADLVVLSAEQPTEVPSP